MAEPFFSRIFNSTTQTLNRIFPWHKLNRNFGVVLLFGIRDRLRRLNLHDTGLLPSKNGKEAGKCEAAYLVSRTHDGTYNDLSSPTMGAAGTRFGRNVPLENVYPEQSTLLIPNPRTLSRELLTREHFQPARTLNLLAAAWIQFMVHDWFSHGENEERNPHEIPLLDDDPWPQKPMQIPRTQVDKTRPEGDGSGPPTFINTATHWWDASQVYGTDRETEMRLRSGIDGKLKLGDNGLLPLDARGIDDTGVNGNWWIGLSLMHNVFAREHNAICDRLRSVYPGWSDQDLFLRARLINSALLAKIHTVQWTPAILNHPTIVMSMNGIWWGLATERITKAFGRLTKTGDAISGVPGSETNHHSAPYAFTEEFVAVYRMHSLMPDVLSFRSAETDEPIFECTLPEASGRATRPAMMKLSFDDLVYSFGTSNPGALVLHNYPRFLQTLHKDDGTLLDMASVDILRDRERGIPRYNKFRELMHMPRVKSFDKLTDNPKWAQELQRLYNNDIDSVDLIVGTLAESPRPAGFGFSETAFRIFLLMANRRLKSDRFFTVDYTPRVYTPAGIDWINNNDFATVLQRHVPGIEPAFAKVKNPFFPWQRMGNSGDG
jgi:hypothetical protein